MQHDFDRSIFHSRLVNGRLKDAMSYLALFPSQSELYGRYVSRFQEENYCAYDVAPELNKILLAYQKYYRDAFYLRLSREEAEEICRAEPLVMGGYAGYKLVGLQIANRENNYLL